MQTNLENNMKLFINTLIVAAFLCLFTSSLQAQGIAYPLNNEAVYHHIDRFDILYGHNAYLHTAHKTYSRGDVTKYALSLDSSKHISDIDRAALQYIYDDNNEWLTQNDLPLTLTGKRDTANEAPTPPQYRRRKKPLLKYFYQTPANLFEIHQKGLDIKLNPIINVSLSKGKDDAELAFVNQRGVELRGSIDNRVYFYTNIVESQSRFPNYVTTFIEKNQAIPDAGLYKPYPGLLFKIRNGYDYLNAQGIIGFNVTPHIGVQMGHGKQFIGDGMRSLLLSDFANNYTFLRINTKIWKFDYQNIFAQLHADNHGNSSSALVGKKYMAFHQLSYNVNSRLNIGIFESVISHRAKRFDVEYFNPLIFYRSIEHGLGSPDNVILGANFKWNVAKRFSIYGQLILDEFYFQKLFLDNQGWWANKYGGQIGVKYINAFNIDHLDLQVEYNKVRPFTYSHFDSLDNYTHGNLPLAHPLGANFKEFIFKARYQPTWKWLFEGRIMSATAGENAANVNWGNDPYIPYDRNRKTEYGYFTTAGVKAKTLLVTFDASYQLYHNMFLDFHMLARKKDSQDVTRNERTLYFGGGFRMNFGNLRLDF